MAICDICGDYIDCDGCDGTCYCSTCFILRNFKSMKKFGYRGSKVDSIYDAIIAVKKVYPQCVVDINKIKLRYIAEIL